MTVVAPLLEGAAVVLLLDTGGTGPPGCLVVVDDDDDDALVDVDDVTVDGVSPISVTMITVGTG